MGSLKSVLVLFIFGLFSGSLASRTAFHRTTSLDELKEIDSYVATGLPLFDHGFFVNTAQGPILVKANDEEGTKSNKPRLNPGYYSTLPRLIPSGYEGLSISHFNLGSAVPAQEPSILNHFYQQDSSQANAPHFQHQQSHQTLQYAQQAQPSINVPQQFRQQPSQTESRQFIQHTPQERHDDRFPHRSHQQSPIAQDTFQINNFLNAQNDNVPTSYQNTMISHEPFGVGPFGSRNLVRNPTVQQALEFEDELPENLKNPFYKNEGLASILAQESLPLEGEQIVGEWDTTKIQKRKIHALLTDAGFLRR